MVRALAAFGAVAIALLQGREARADGARATTEAQAEEKKEEAGVRTLGTSGLENENDPTLRVVQTRAALELHGGPIDRRVARQRGGFSERSDEDRLGPRVHGHGHRRRLWRAHLGGRRAAGFLDVRAFLQLDRPRRGRRRVPERYGRPSHRDLSSLWIGRRVPGSRHCDRDGHGARGRDAKGGPGQDL